MGAKGGSAALFVVVIIIGLFFAFDIAPNLFPPSASVVETGPAVALANQVKTLPTLDYQVCQGAPSLVANALTIIQDMDGTLGTDFGHVAQFDASNCDFVVQFLPILGTYNLLVRDSRSVDANNSTSVKIFYEDAFLLSSDVIIINDGVAYKVAFRSTGEMNDALKLAKLKEVCGDECYRFVLSGIRWAIRLYMNQFLCDFESWASH